MTTRVVTVITRLEGGAGALALRGVLGLDRVEFEQVIVTGSGGRLVEQAAAHGVEVVVHPVLKPTIDPLSDLRAARWLAALLADRQPDVVHTHCAKAGTIGRLAARRAGIAHDRAYLPRVPVPRVPVGCQAACLRRGRAAARQVHRCRAVRRDRRCRGGDSSRPHRARARADDRACRSIVAGGRSAAAAADVARARRRLGIADGDLIVGAVGRLTYQKAPEDFVAAIGALRQAGCRRRLGRRRRACSCDGATGPGGRPAHRAVRRPQRRRRACCRRSTCLRCRAATRACLPRSRRPWRWRAGGRYRGERGGGPGGARRYRPAGPARSRPDLMASAVRLPARLASRGGQDGESGAQAVSGPRYGVPALRAALATAYYPRC